MSDQPEEDRLREEFEAWYAAQMSADIGRDVPVSEICALRRENGFYGGLDYLNGCWMGFRGGRTGLVRKVE